MFKVSSIQYIYRRIHTDPASSQSQSISHLITSPWIYTIDFWLMLLFSEPAVLPCRLQPHMFFWQFSCPLLSLCLALWPSGALESPLKSHTTARRALNVSIRVMWAAWSLTSEPWEASRELSECTEERLRSFPLGRRGVVMVPSSSVCSMSLMTSQR